MPAREVFGEEEIRDSKDALREHLSLRDLEHVVEQHWTRAISVSAFYLYFSRDPECDVVRCVCPCSCWDKTKHSRPSDLIAILMIASLAMQASHLVILV